MRTYATGARSALCGARVGPMVTGSLARKIGPAPAPAHSIATTPMHSAAAYRPLDSAAPAGQWSNVTRFDVSVPDHPVVIELTP